MHLDWQFLQVITHADDSAEQVASPFIGRYELEHSVGLLAELEPKATASLEKDDASRDAGTVAFDAFIRRIAIPEDVGRWQMRSSPAEAIEIMRKETMLELLDQGVRVFGRRVCVCGGGLICVYACRLQIRFDV